MKAPLAQQRCLNHADREAVARCPECHRHFCRECVSEHDDRILCAACLSRQIEPAAASRKSRFKGGVVVLAQFALAFLAIWFFFYLVAAALLSIPSSFHEGTMWKTFPIHSG